jgi:HD-like signal output (HDOD) protein/ActR/RegA family two-component response regulator
VNSVLFVDDEEHILKGLKLAFHGARSSMGVHTASSGEEALGLLDQQPDIAMIVTDLHMPKMDGIELLKTTMHDHPDVVRCMLSGNLTGESTIQASQYAHQMLTKPCETNHLRDVVIRALAVRKRLDEFSLKDELLSLGGLPSIPTQYSQIVAELDAPKPSMDRLTEIIRRDPAMSLKVLQVVNSHSTAGHEISDIDLAVRYIGLDSLKSFVLMAELFTGQDDLESQFGFNTDDLWNHGIQVGEYASAIAETETEDPEILGRCYTAGLLHDLGVLFFASKLPERFAEALKHAEESKKTLMQAEKDLFGATHAEIGGFLLDLWGLAMPVVNAITYHYFPSGAPEEVYMVHEHMEVDPLLVVHVANYFSEDQDSMGDDAISLSADVDYLEKMHSLEKLDHWWDVCQECRTSSS